MFWKKHIRNMLYDFLSGELTEAEKSSVEKHLASCTRCSKERKRIEQALQLLSAEKAETPDLPQNYWENYWRTIEPKLEERPIPPVRELLELWKSRRPARIFSPRLAYSFIGFAVGAVVMLAILFPYLGRKNETETPTTAPTQAVQTEAASVNNVAEEFSGPFIRFFQKAKAFLIAVKNLDEPKEAIRDLTADQETVKKLATECQSLRRQSLDPREQQLLSELDGVLAELSQVKDETDVPRLNLIRQEIERNNLVMKVRVHELAHEVRLLQASARGQGSNE